MGIKIQKQIPILTMSSAKVYVLRVGLLLSRLLASTLLGFHVGDSGWLWRTFNVQRARLTTQESVDLEGNTWDWHWVFYFEYFFYFIF